MIHISSLSKQFGTGPKAFRAVNGVSFDVREGSLVSLLGPSGCGKTTTLRMIAGLEKPTSGRLDIDGVPTFSEAGGIFVPVNRRPIGMVFQSYAIWPHMNVAQNVAYPLKVQRPRARKAEIKERVLEALELVGLASVAERGATALSGGQQQRVALARALVRRPKILLLDEPLSNLDAELRERMREEIRLLQQKLHITTVFVTHDQAEAVAISDEIIVMDKGRLVESGQPQDVYRRPRSDFAARFLGVSNRFVGVVERAEEGKAVVKVDQGLITGQRHRECAVGERVVAVVRPSGFSLSKEREGDDWWEGKVQHGTYRGDSWDYSVEVGSVTLSVRSHELDLGVQSGDHVYVKAQPGSTVILDDPDAEPTAAANDSRGRSHRSAD